MATPAKKTGTARKGSTAKKRKNASRAPRPRRREIGSAVCALLGLCLLVSYFGVDAILVNAMAHLFRSLTGYGYYGAGVALLFASLVLLFHHGRPVRLRVSSILLFPLSIGALGHQLLSHTDLALTRESISALRTLGEAGEGGGVLSGLLSLALQSLLGHVLTVIVLLLVLLAQLLIALRLSPSELAQKVKEHPRAEYEPEPERERPAASAAPKAHRAEIDIPLGEEGKPAKRSRLGSLLRPRSAEVRTPDELLREQAEETAQSGTQPEKAAQAVEAAAALPPQPSAEPQGLRKAEKPESKADRTMDDAELEAQREAVTEEISQRMEQEAEEQYAKPPLDLLEKGQDGSTGEADAELRNNSRRLSETLQSFGVDAAAGDVVRGPSVTRYEFVLDQGVKLSKITNLSDDIALALGSSGVRIAPIPNKISAVGVEVPNKKVDMVRIRDVLESPDFTRHSSTVAFALGKDISGHNIVGNLAKLPHVLIAGTTGSGKSVCTNSLIVSMLYKSTPEEVRFIMVDPKMVELAPYNGIPHLLIPVVTDPKKAAGALQWAVFEMMKRYRAFSERNVKDLESYNALAATDPEVTKLPTVVVVIDELADLMLVAAKEVEESICRVAQMGRAAGMHLVIATQRPSADVITGIMKANIPSRIAFAVASSLESRIILDQTGAEKLVGRGDMLYAPLGAGKPTRVQGCLISAEEIERVVSFVKESGSPDYSQEVMQKIEESVLEKEKGTKNAAAAAQDDAADEGDELLPAAVDVLLETGQASVSMLQRRLKLGYSRAARLVDQMEERGYVGPYEGSKARQLLITAQQWEEIKAGRLAAKPPEADEAEE